MFGDLVNELLHGRGAKSAKKFKIKVFQVIKLGIKALFLT